MRATSLQPEKVGVLPHDALLVSQRGRRHDHQGPLRSVARMSRASTLTKAKAQVSRQTDRHGSDTLCRGRSNRARVAGRTGAMTAECVLICFNGHKKRPTRYPSGLRPVWGAVWQKLEEQRCPLC